jgi:hypothetical protein
MFGRPDSARSQGLTKPCEAVSNENRKAISGRTTQACLSLATCHDYSTCIARHRHRRTRRMDARHSQGQAPARECRSYPSSACQRARSEPLVKTARFAGRGDRPCGSALSFYPKLNLCSRTGQVGALPCGRITHEPAGTPRRARYWVDGLIADVCEEAVPRRNPGVDCRAIARTVVSSKCADWWKSEGPAGERCHHRVSEGRVPLSQTESAKDSGHYQSVVTHTAKTPCGQPGPERQASSAVALPAPKY